VNPLANEILIRRAEFKDADAIAGIHYASRAAAMPWLAVVHSALETRGFVARVLLKKENVYVAALEGKVIGYASHDVAGRAKWLSHLYVHPDYQRRGVGTMLFAHAKRSMPDGFKFWVFQRNVMARSFYEKHGAVLIRETDGLENEEREPDVEYGWNLAADGRR
jgi:putative acetyltransferase